MENEETLVRLCDMSAKISQEVRKIYKAAYGPHTTSDFMKKIASVNKHDIAEAVDAVVTDMLLEHGWPLDSKWLFMHLYYHKQGEVTRPGQNWVYKVLIDRDLWEPYTKKETE